MKVSIIIPIYNVAPYIEECLRSVMNQTMTEGVECILVDDCGEDNSMEIAERLIAGYDGKMEFRILHHECNRGLSAARNTGIDAARGEYIYFLDSDDWIEPNCIELLYKEIKKDLSVEIVIGQINVVGYDLHKDIFGPPGIHTSDFIEKVCISHDFYTMAWNKLISVDFLKSHNLYFKEGLYHEDDVWSIQTACVLKKMVAIHDVTYNYIKRKGSIQNNSSQAFHKMHMGQGRIELLNYIFNNHFENNGILYEFISKDIFKYICGRSEGNYRNEYLFYKKFRNTPYWSLSQIARFREITSSLRIIELHRKLPVLFGFHYFRLLYSLKSYFYAKK